MVLQILMREHQCFKLFDRFFLALAKCDGFKQLHGRYSRAKTPILLESRLL